MDSRIGISPDGRISCFVLKHCTWLAVCSWQQFGIQTPLTSFVGSPHFSAVELLVIYSLYN